MHLVPETGGGHGAMGSTVTITLADGRRFERHVDSGLLEAGELVQVSLTGQRLLALLACRSGSLVRSQIAHILWPDTINARAAASLRTTLYRLERTCPGLVVATRTHLRLAAGMRVDLEQSTKLATRILAADLPANAELLEDALRANLYDDLLPNWDEDWLTEHQSRFHQLRLESLEALSARLTAAGHHGAAVLAAQAAVHADSLRDSAHESLIRACVVQGNRHDALVHFAAYKRTLQAELGVEPADAIGQLLDCALTQPNNHPEPEQSPARLLPRVVGLPT